jgi:hypothetical protein
MLNKQYWADILLHVECDEWQVEQKRNPVAIDKE